MKTNFRLILLGMLVAFQWHQSSFFALASAKTSGFRSDNTSKSALAPMATFAVTSPTASTVATEGSSLTVIWDVAGTNAAPISASLVSISLSVDASPQSYILLINTPNDGSQVVTLPAGTKSNSAKITVIASGTGGIVSATSSVFTIGGNYCFPRGACISAFGDAPIQSFQITNSAGSSVLFSNSNTGCGIEPGNPAYSNYASTISLRPILARGTSYRLVSTGCAASTCLGAGYGYYIDLNRDGLFNGTGEYIGGTDPATGQVPLNWTVPNTYGEGFYRFRIKSESGRKPLAGEACGGFTNSGEAEDYLVFISNYCAPGYQNSCTQSFINSFVFGSYSNNNTGCANQGSTGNYSLTTISPTQLDNFTHVFSASIGGTLGAAFVGMYIDFNNDFDFSDAGEMVYSSSAKALSHASVINIPQGISGSRRMRVRSSAIESLGLDGSCITRTVGETEDYTIVFGSGIMANGDQPICNGGDPNNITLSTLPPSGSTYQWFSQPGLIAAPLTTAPTAGWTLISGQTSSSFNPIAGVTSNITYACRITTSNGESRWVSGVRKVTVLPLVNYGTLASGNQTFSETGDPSLIGFSTAPSGGNGTFAYRWYKADGLVAAPTGTTIPANWTLISGATSSSYDPPILFGNTSYAVMVDPTGSQNCGGFTWAAGVRQITINNSCLSYCKPDRAALSPNSSLYLSSVTLGGQTQTSGFNNHYGNFGLTNYFTKGTTVSFSINATGSTGITRYYAVFADWNRDGDFSDGLAEIVGLSGSSTSSTFSGSITIPTTALGGRTTIRTYVIAGYNPLSNSCPSLSNDLWVGEVEDYCVYISNGLNPGTIAAGNQDLCSNSIPGSMAVSGFSPTTGTSFQWYFRDGIVSAPASSVGIDGWTPISGATSGTFTPTTPLTSSRSYACRVSSGGSSLWASGVRQITIRAVFNSGTLAASNQTFTGGSGDPATISFSTLPSGGRGTFAYRWYSQPGIHPAPTGTIVQAGWTLITGQTSSSFNPPVISASTSYAVMVDPTGTPDCGVFTWASGVSQITIVPVGFTPGALSSFSETICNGGDPSAIVFSEPATPGSTFQWFFKNGVLAGPANNDPIGSWSILSGETNNTLDLPAGLTQSRTFACRVTNGTNSQWATGGRNMNVLAAFTPGSVITNQTLCAPYDPAPITMVTNPQGSGQYKWDWYYVENTTATCPTVASTTTGPSGWTTNSADIRFTGTSTTGVGISFDASSAGTNGRTWVLRIIPQASGTTPACGTAQFTNCHRTFRSTTCREAVDALEANNDKMEVGQNIPNPFFDQTSISYFIPSGNGDGQLEVVSINGKVLITELVHEGVRGEVTILKGRLAPGTYFYRLKTMGTMTRTQKMVVQ